LVTDVPGASGYFLGSAVTYANTAKADMLGVDPVLIDTHGAVSEPVARAMASGCRERFGSNLSVACSGIMGPDGGTADKPVGLVYIALADRDGCQISVHRMGAHAGRAMLRDRTASTALNMLRLRLLGDH
jgi:nicotinamide-nucleotide amidase